MKRLIFAFSTLAVIAATPIAVQAADLDNYDEIYGARPPVEGPPVARRYEYYDEAPAAYYEPGYYRYPRYAGYWGGPRWYGRPYWRARGYWGGRGYWGHRGGYWGHRHGWR
jgi:hypothetical protein